MNIGIIHHHLAMAHLGPCKFLHHEPGRFLRHFKETAVGREVNATHLDFSLHIAIDDTNDFARIEIVALTQIDKQPGQSRLGLPRSALALPPATSLLSLCFALRRLSLLGLHNLGGIGIIAQKAPKCILHHSLDNIVLAEPLQLVHDFGQKGRNLVFVHLGALQFIDGPIELLGAYFSRLGQRATLKALANSLLNAAHLMLLAHVNDADACAALAGSPRSARPMGVVLHVIGQSVVDNVRKVVDIEPSRSHIGSHEQLRVVLSELLHRQVALLLRKIAVQGLRIIAVANQHVGHFLRFKARATKHYGIYPWIIVYYALQSQILILGLYQIVNMVHAFGSLIAAAHYNLLVVVQIVLGNSLNFAAHRGRKEQCVALGRHPVENFVDVVRKTHVKHFVGLVEHHVFHPIEHRHAALHQVYEPARCGHHHLCSTPERPNLRSNVGAAIDRKYAHAIHIARKIAQVACNLQAQFARRAKHHRLHHSVFHINLLQHGQTIGRSLACSSLGQSYHVVATAQQIGDNLLLNRHWLLKAQFTNGAQQFGRHTKLFESLHNRVRSYNKNNHSLKPTRFFQTQRALFQSKSLNLQRTIIFTCA